MTTEPGQAAPDEKPVKIKIRPDRDLELCELKKAIIRSALENYIQFQKDTLNGMEVCGMLKEKDIIMEFYDYANSVYKEIKKQDFIILIKRG